MKENKKNEQKKIKSEEISNNNIKRRDCPEDVIQSRNKNKL